MLSIPDHSHYWTNICCPRKIFFKNGNNNKPTRKNEMINHVFMSASCSKPTRNNSNNQIILLQYSPWITAKNIFPWLSAREWLSSNIIFRLWCLADYNSASPAPNKKQKSPAYIQNSNALHFANSLQQKALSSY